MNPDDNVCLCFRVSQRKIVNFCKRERPRVASQISTCLSAGTGCGWCIPFIEKLHKQVIDGQEEPDLAYSPEEYARRRMNFRSTGKRDETPQQTDETGSQASPDDTQD